jgi:hypothetical protein
MYSMRLDNDLSYGRGSVFMFYIFRCGTKKKEVVSEFERKSEAEYQRPINEAAVMQNDKARFVVLDYNGNET